MIEKTLKWLLPIISYLVFIGFFYLVTKIDLIIGGPRLSDTPIILPESFMFIIFSPLILFGYILIIVSQYLYNKREKLFTAFAYSLTTVTVVYVIISQLKYIADWTYFIFIVLPPILLYYMFFFISLFHLLRKRKVLHEKEK